MHSSGMRFVAYTSKLWFLLMLGIIASFAAGVGLVWNQLPVPLRIIFCLLLGVALLAIAFQLASTSPAVTADENGLTCYKAVYRTIAWEDIENSVRVPRVEKYRHFGETGWQMSFTDAWRPVDVFVRDIGKYSKNIPPKLNSALNRLNLSEEHPGCFRFRVDLTGTTGSSEQLQSVIQYYIAATKKNARS